MNDEKFLSILLSFILAIIVAVVLANKVHADVVNVEMSWDSVDVANAYKAQYNVNGGDWSYIDTTETSVMFAVTLSDGDVVRGLVRGCFKLATSCPEGDFSNSASVTYEPSEPEKEPAPQNFQIRIIE